MNDRARILSFSRPAMRRGCTDRSLRVDSHRALTIVQDKGMWDEIPNSVPWTARDGGCCGSRATSVASPAHELVQEKAAPGGTNASVRKLSLGDPAPPLFVSRWIKGQKFDRFEPGKVYVLDFWATWCGPCIESFPHLTRLQKQYADKGVTVIGVSIWEEDQSVVEPLALKARVEIAEGQSEAALRTIAIGLAFGHHVASGPFLLHPFIATSMDQLMFDRLDDLITTPDAPTSTGRSPACPGRSSTSARPWSTSRD